MAGSGDSLAATIPLVKSATSEATIIGYIRQTTAAADVYVFGELLALENVQKLSLGSADAKKALKTLELFCYGRYSDITKAKDDYMPLTDKQSRKLKQLSIISLAAESRVIPYKTLQAELDVPNLRDLEDLVIDALYRNIFVGKLDHANSQLQVDSAIGRDVRATEIDAMLRALRNWEVASKQLLTVLEKEAKKAREAVTDNEKHAADFNKKLEDSKATVKIALDQEADTERSGAGMMGMITGFDYGGGGGKKGHGGKKDGKFRPGQRHGY